MTSTYPSICRRTLALLVDEKKPTANTLATDQGQDSNAALCSSDLIERTLVSRAGQKIIGDLQAHVSSLKQVADTLRKNAASDLTCSSPSAAAVAEEAPRIHLEREADETIERSEYHEARFKEVCDQVTRSSQTRADACKEESAKRWRRINKLRDDRAFDSAWLAKYELITCRRANQSANAG